MKNNKYLSFIKRMGAILLGLMVGFLPCFKMDAEATEVNTSVPAIILEKYSVTNEQIVPGEDVTLTLYLKNCSETQDAKNVILDITNPDGMIPLYGTVSQIYIDSIAAGETKEVSVDYYAETSIDTTFVDFSLTVILGTTASNYISLRVPAGMDVPFSIISASLPDSAMVGDNVTASLTFEVLGDENVRNVVTTMSVGGEIIGSSTVGTVTPGTIRTQNTISSFNSPGEYLIELGISYTDKTEQTQHYVIGKKAVTIYEVEDAGYGQMDASAVKNEEMHKSLLLGVMGVGILAVFVILLLMRKKK